jgi:hypothetical protein
VARIEYPAIRATSFVSIVVYLQREQRVFFTFPTILSRKHDGTGKLIFFIRGGIIVDGINFFIRGGIIVDGINFYYACVFSTI